MTTAVKLIAYHGDHAMKIKYLSRVCAHAKADRLIQGIGWENGKGCAVGCTLEAYDHIRYEPELGIPWRVAILEDAIFELLPRDEAMKWPERFLKAIEPGSDLSLVPAQFMIWMLVDPKDGVIRFAKGNGEVAIREVAKLWECHLNGKEPSSAARSEARSAAWSEARSAAWSAARSAARSAAWSAAESAARSAADSAARSAAWSAARSAAWSATRSAAWSTADSAARSAAWSAARSAAWSAAWSAADSAARSAAWSAAVRAQADKLIELLKEAPRG